MPERAVEESLATEYAEQLTPQQKKVLTIAKDHLGSSFNIVRSIGFKQWLESRNAAKAESAE